MATRALGARFWPLGNMIIAELRDEFRQRLWAATVAFSGSRDSRHRAGPKVRQVAATTTGRRITSLSVRSRGIMAVPSDRGGALAECPAFYHVLLNQQAFRQHLRRSPAAGLSGATPLPKVHCALYWATCGRVRHIACVRAVLLQAAAPRARPGRRQAHGGAE
jgi:hypothetical protein